MTPTAQGSCVVLVPLGEPAEASFEASLRTFRVFGYPAWRVKQPGFSPLVLDGILPETRVRGFREVYVLNLAIAFDLKAVRCSKPMFDRLSVQKRRPILCKTQDRIRQSQPGQSLSHRNKSFSAGSKMPMPCLNCCAQSPSTATDSRM